MDFYKSDFNKFLEEKRRRGEYTSDVVIEAFHSLPKYIWDEFIEKDHGFHFMASDAVSIDRFLYNMSDEEVIKKYNLKVPDGWLLATDFDTINNYDWVVETKHFNNLKWAFYERIKTKLNTYDPLIKSKIGSFFNLNDGIVNLDEFFKISISDEDFNDFIRYSKIIIREKETSEKKENSKSPIHI
jgi:hypothetical protein